MFSDVVLNMLTCRVIRPRLIFWGNPRKKLQQIFKMFSVDPNKIFTLIQNCVKNKKTFSNFFIEIEVFYIRALILTRNIFIDSEFARV